MLFTPTVSQERLSSIRRELHKHAESGLSEFWTTAFLASQLEAAGYVVTTGDAIADRATRLGLPDDATQHKRLLAALDQGADPEWIRKMNGITGLVADLRPDLPMHTVLRFDIDAVDVDESSDPSHKPVQAGFRSLNKGTCHACAHDGHAAIGLGTALELIRYREKFRHNVRLIFEPAEEGVRGAVPMINAGVVDGARYFFAAHIGTNATQNHSLVCGTEGFLATTKFDVELTGKASHAGSAPQDGHDSILAAANIIMNLHAISRHGKGETRINVGRIEGGAGRNVIPAHARLVCETRGATSEINDFMVERAKRIIKHAAEMYEQEYNIIPMGKSDSAVSDQNMIELVKTVSRHIPYFHQDLLVEMGQGYGADDACEFIRAIQKQGGYGTYAQIGSALAADHHNQNFDFEENLLQPTVELFCRMALSMDLLD